MRVKLSSLPFLISSMHISNIIGLDINPLVYLELAYHFPFAVVEYRCHLPIKEISFGPIKEISFLFAVA